MGILSRFWPILSRKNALSRYGTAEEAAFWSKVSVNHPYRETAGAFGVMAALRAGMVIAQGIGQVPLQVVEEKDDGEVITRKRAVRERTYKLLNRRPNDWMTSIEFREAMSLHAVFTGTGRALVRRGADGRPLDLLPLMPAWVDCRFDQARQEYVYDVGISDYGIYGQFTRDDIIEVTNPRWDYIRGLNVTREAAAALGLSANLEGRQHKMSERNAPYGVITSSDSLSSERIAKLKEAWQSQFGEGHGIGILDFSAKFEQMMGTAQDQQIIENRKFQVEEIGRAFGVFPQMLMASDTTTTFASAESFFNAHLVHTMQPWFERWEQGIDRTLFNSSRNLCAKFDERALIRMSQSDQAEYLARALGSGGNAPWMTQNEARAYVGLNPLPGGDVLNISQGGESDGNEVSQV